MTTSSFRQEKLHTIGGSLLVTMGALRKLGQILEASTALAADEQKAAASKELMQKLTVSVEKVCQAFTELRRDMADSDETQADDVPVAAAAALEPRISIYDPSRAAALQISTQLSKGKHFTTELVTVEAIAAYKVGDVVLIGLDSSPAEALLHCQNLRQSQLGSKLVIIVLTTEESPQVLYEFLAAGVDDFFSKALSIDHLAMQIRGALFRRREAGSPPSGMAEAALSSLALALLRQPVTVVATAQSQLLQLHAQLRASPGGAPSQLLETSKELAEFNEAISCISRGLLPSAGGF